MYSANFRRYWKEQILHFAVGAVSGVLLVSGYHWGGFGILTLVIARQSLEWGNRAMLPLMAILVKAIGSGTVDWEALEKWRKERDTPGIDLAYHLAGCLAGVGVGVVIELVR